MEEWKSGKMENWKAGNCPQPTFLAFYPY
jgi:hypothetical protein